MSRVINAGLYPEFELSNFPGKGVIGTMIYGKTKETGVPHCYQVRRVNKTKIPSISLVELDQSSVSDKGVFTGTKVKQPLNPIGLYTAKWSPTSGWVVTVPVKTEHKLYHVVDFRPLSVDQILSFNQLEMKSL